MTIRIDRKVLMIGVTVGLLIYAAAVRAVLLHSSGDGYSEYASLDKWWCTLSDADATGREVLYQITANIECPSATQIARGFRTELESLSGRCLRSCVVEPGFTCNVHKGVPVPKNSTIKCTRGGERVKIVTLPA